MNKKKKSQAFGKYGLISLSDMFIHKLEFNAWLSEIKKVLPHALNQFNEKKYFEEFLEAYNNAELPNKKYYDITKYQAKEIDRVLRKRKREKDRLLANANLVIENEDAEFVFDDEGKKEKEKKILKELEQQKKLDEAIYTMNREKAEAMREVEIKENLMRYYYQTSNIDAAKDLHKQVFGVKREGENATNAPPIEPRDEEDG